MRAFLNLLRDLAAPIHGPASRESRTVGWQSARLEDKAAPKEGPSFDAPGFTPAEAIALTEHMQRKKASRFLGDTTLFFDQRVTVCVPHTSLPIERGWGSFDLEIAGSISSDLVSWLWDVSLDCNMLFYDYGRPTAIIGEPTPQLLSRWPQIFAMKDEHDLAEWLTESRSSLIY